MSVDATRLPEPDRDQAPLRRHDLDDDPIRQFNAWFAEVVAAGVPQPNAMTLATAPADGRPSARIVLLKEVDDDGRFVFYGNRESRKGRDLEANPFAALVFYWSQLGRQVRVSGGVGRLSDEHADAYFASRPPMSRIGAWASAQGRPLPDRATLDSRVREAEERFGDGEIPRPEYWIGYALTPETIEFWQNRPNRLHDRFLYERAGDGWTVTRLSP
jgi:pyridoxamine 5'-phosphate oxidase